MLKSSRPSYFRRSHYAVDAALKGGLLGGLCLARETVAVCAKGDALESVTYRNILTVGYWTSRHHP